MTRITMTAIGTIAFAILPATAQVADDPVATPQIESPSMLPSTVNPMLDPDKLEAEVDQGSDLALEYDEDAVGGVYYESEEDAAFEAEVESEMSDETDIKADIDADVDLETEVETPDTD